MRDTGGGGGRRSGGERRAAAWLLETKESRHKRHPRALRPRPAAKPCPPSPTRAPPSGVESAASHSPLLKGGGGRVSGGEGERALGHKEETSGVIASSRRSFLVAGNHPRKSSLTANPHRDRSQKTKKTETFLYFTRAHTRATRPFRTPPSARARTRSTVVAQAAAEARRPLEPEIPT